MYVVKADLNRLLEKARNPRLVLEAYLEDLEQVLEQARALRDAERAEHEMYAARVRDLRAAARSMEKKALLCLE
ncbi:MAG: hypothetical protein D6806_08950, partial [Deltaproteobacteria bacterium]